ncbi:hypothetical protein B5E84_07575 [Lachnoclostridium sp. An14]|nr:hypothetical protein B5E84_07575 [Lachnoclostridium sp. An14]
MICREMESERIKKHIFCPTDRKEIPSGGKPGSGRRTGPIIRHDSRPAGTGHGRQTGNQPDSWGRQAPEDPSRSPKARNSPNVCIKIQTIKYL